MKTRDRTLRAFLAVFVTVAFLSSVSPARAQTATLDVSPQERVTAKYIPDRHSELAPLIVLLHGYGQTLDSLVRSVPLLDLARQEGWYLIAPSGRLDAREWRHWDATPTCCGHGRRFSAGPTEDVDYLRDVIRRELVLRPIDRDRVIVVGLSNGGFMAYQMACHASDLVAAIVPIAAAEGELAEDCAPRRPVSVFHIHGRFDRAVFFEGGVVGVAPEAYAPYPGAVETVVRWAARNDCPTGPGTGDALPRDNAGEWVNCAEGSEVRYRWLPDAHAVTLTTELLEDIHAFIDQVDRPVAPAH